eukprot:1046047-Pleurochrysis_carterae.AAC.2
MPMAMYAERVWKFPDAKQGHARLSNVRKARPSKAKTVQSNVGRRLIACRRHRNVEADVTNVREAPTGGAAGRRRRRRRACACARWPGRRCTLEAQ